MQTQVTGKPDNSGVRPCGVAQKVPNPRCRNSTPRSIAPRQSARRAMLPSLLRFRAVVVNVECRRPAKPAFHGNRRTPGSAGPVTCPEPSIEAVFRARRDHPSSVLCDVASAAPAHKHPPRRPCPPGSPMATNGNTSTVAMAEYEQNVRRMSSTTPAEPVTRYRTRRYFASNQQQERANLRWYEGGKRQNTTEQRSRGRTTMNENAEGRTGRRVYQRPACLKRQPNKPEYATR